MIVSIHQPHFLPWMGYVNKALSSDVFVWLDTVQYRKNYFQNRTRIKQPDDRTLWLTLPVHARLGTPISKVTIAGAGWREQVRKTVEQCYGKAPFFAECWPPLAAAMADSPDLLSDVTRRTFAALLGLLKGKLPEVRPAETFPTSSSDPTQRLVEICTALGATQYIAGKGGRSYLRSEAFEKAGIEVLWQEFDPASLIYPQRGRSFVPGLSAIDCLFNAGPERTRQLAEGAWLPPR